MGKQTIKIGDINIKLSKMGIDFYIKSKQVCWLNTKGTEALKKFLSLKRKAPSLTNGGKR